MTEDPAKFCANRKRVCSRSTILSFLPAFAKNSCSTAKACCHVLEYKYALAKRKHTKRLLAKIYYSPQSKISMYIYL